MQALTGVGQALISTLFPPVCPVCRTETGESRTLCPACWSETHFLSGTGCASCGRPVAGIDATDTGFRCDDCLRTPRLWDHGQAVMAYSGTGRKLVLALKHGDRLDMVPMLAEWLARAGDDMASRADWIVPVPIHWTRRLRRRANQSAELARALCRTTARPDAYAPEILTRIRRTPSQDGRNREERALNVAGAFAVRPHASGTVRNAEILLIDDVMTTGATLNAAAKALRVAGAARINVLVMALVLTGTNPYLGAEGKTEPEGIEQ